MRILDGKIRLAATDVSNHLACHHLTMLDLDVMRGKRTAPQWAAPDLLVLQQLGLRHEHAYLKFLEQEKKLSVVNVGELDPAVIEQNAWARAQMHCPTELVTIPGAGHLFEEPGTLDQVARLAAEWFGRPDVLLRIARPSGKWLWSYEVVDTKLTRETKAGTILQLSFYSELLAKVQCSDPELLWVVPPGNYSGEAYRVAEYAAYFRHVKNRLAGVVRNGNAEAAVTRNLYAEHRKLETVISPMPLANSPASPVPWRLGSGTARTRRCC